MIVALALAFSPAQVFDSPRSIGGAIAGPSVTIAADMDGDGLADTVCFDFQLRRVLWAKSRPGFGPGPSPGQGIARLETLFDVPVGGGPLSPATLHASDVDADGDLDLIVSGPKLQGLASEVYVSYSASGQFGAAQLLAEVPGRVLAAGTLDLDGDGLPELVVFSRAGAIAPSEVSLVLPNQGGSFGPSQPLFSGAGLFVDRLQTGDLNGDGADDLLLANAIAPGTSGSFDTLVALNTGSLTLDASAAVRITGPVNDAELGDLDGDGDLDLVAVDSSAQGTIQSFLNQGSLAFTPGPSPVTGPGDITTNLELGDRDGDGDLDLFASIRPGGSIAMVSLYDWDNGSFVRALPQFASAAGQLGFEAADLTGDGLADIAMTVGSANASSLLFLHADPPAGSNPFSEQTRLGEAFARGSVRAFDANGDGDLDLLVVSQGRGALEGGIAAVKLGLGGGSYGAPIPLDAATFLLQEPATGDFTGDGIQDIATLNESFDSIALFPGNGDGSFGIETGGLPVTGAPNSLSVSDLDGDGVDDIVYTSLPGSRVFYAFGSTTGSFVGAAAISGGFSQRVAPATADVDGDGDQDLLYLLGSEIEISINDGQRGFEPRTTLAAGLQLATSFEKVLSGDLDGDGVLDLLIPGRHWLRGLGGGTFAAAAPVQGGLVFSSTGELADIDLDGDLDLLFRTSDAIIGGTRWYENLGSLSFGPFMTFETEPNRQVVKGDMADLDGDGDLDVIGSLGFLELVAMDNLTLGSVGSGYCGPAIANSTGERGELAAAGSTDLALGRLALRASSLPASTFGFFLTSQSQSDVIGIPGSVGRLCLGGAIGRFIGPGQVQNSGSSGQFSLDLDLQAFPDPQAGLVPVQLGETWSFQAWHRDTASGGGGATSNFTTAVAVTF